MIVKMGEEFVRGGCGEKGLGWAVVSDSSEAGYVPILMMTDEMEAKTKVLFRPVVKPTIQNNNNNNNPPPPPHPNRDKAK